MKSIQLLLPALLILVAACQTPLPEKQLWKGTVKIADGQTADLSFSLDLTTSPPTGYFLVGDEQTQIPEIIRHGDSLSFVISEYGVEMKALWKQDTLLGRYYRYRADTTYLEFEATPVGATAPYGAPVPPSSPPSIKLVGRFRAFFTEGGVVDTSNAATFWARNDSIFGTIVEASGDHGLLAGVQTGNHVVLHRFTGWQIHRLDLSYADGSWTGKYYSRNLPPQTLSLEPRVAFLARPTSVRNTRMKNANAPFVFEGLTAEGDTLVNTDDRYRGKILIIDIMGTWCHNCLDAAPLLQQLYEDYRDQGLEIIGLAFELKNDYPLAQRNFRIYAKRHGISYPILFCGSTERSNVDARLRSQMDDFFAYPTTIFVGRDGKVKKIHSGFSGPGTGEDYQREIENFTRTVRELLEKK